MFAFTLRGKSIAEQVWLAMWIACVSGALVIGCEPMDGYGGWAVSFLAAIDDTEYSAGYSDRGFRQIKAGMTEQEVLALVGEPLDTLISAVGVGWRYTRSPQSHSYHMRQLMFRDGRVSRVFREYYVD